MSLYVILIIPIMTCDHVIFINIKVVCVRETRGELKWYMWQLDRQLSSAIPNQRSPIQPSTSGTNLKSEHSFVWI